MLSPLSLLLMTGLVLTALLITALGAPGAGADGGLTPADSHAALDSVVHTASQERALDAHTRAVTAPDAQVAAAATAGAPQDVGQWGPVVDWPVVAVHAALLPNGKVLAYDSIGDNATETYPVQDHTRATVWDPATGAQTPVNVDTGFNIFCSGLAHLADGRIFVAGGNKDQDLDGIVQTHLFDLATNQWSLGPNMSLGRWYPTVTPLNNGEMLITSGRVDTPEVRTLAGDLRSLDTASLALPFYPWMDVAPNGRTFYSGPDPTLRALDTTGTGSWQTFGQRDTIDREYGGHAIFDIGKMLIAGGGPSTTDSRVIDFNGATPQVSTTAPMAYGRRQHNLTVLADGTVLATGGNSSGAAQVDLNNGVYAAEQWDPATGQWRTLAAMQITRQYHSTALLLPDGRVLSAGGGVCGLCDQIGYLGKNAEIFSPPYLFQADGTLAPRPAIGAAPAATTYGVPMQIATGNPGSIRKVALVRLGAVTHSDNMEQRYVPLSFTPGATSLTAIAPANANVAPPGFYMLFIIDANGVPSVARMVSVQSAAGNTPPSVTLTQPANGATFTVPANFTLVATASDSDGTVTKVEFFNGPAKLGEDTTAPYTFGWGGMPPYTYALTARATDNLGASTTTPVSMVTVTAANTPPSVTLTQPANGATFTVPATVNLAATASDSDGTVAKVEFFNGAAKLGEDTTAPYSFSWAGVPAGAYSLTARATDDLGAAATTAVSNITVSAAGNTPPSVTLTQPANGATFTAPATVNLAATASDSDGTVAKVEFFNGPAKLGEDTTAPYTFSWGGVPAGAYALTARATDNLGAATTTAVSNITVSAAGNTPPSVTLTQPANGATFTAPATVNLAATASDSDGTVTKVEFFNGPAKLGEDTTAPYTFSWGGVPAGAYSLTARATDNLGAATTTAVSTITVNAGVNTPPSVTLTQPANGATFTVPATVNLAATASDSDGTVAKVEFFNGPAKLGEDTTAPYTFSWGAVPAGTYALTARATDNRGGATTTAVSTITVTANTPPTVSITAPANGAVFPGKADVTVTATASDPGGQVTKVEFRDGTKVLGQDTSAPYSFNWKNAPSGSHVLTALATDNGGAVTTSSPVSITVNPR